MHSCKAMIRLGQVRSLLLHSLLWMLILLVPPTASERPSLLEAESESHLELGRVNKTEAVGGKVIFFARSYTPREFHGGDEVLDVDRESEIKKRLDLLKDRAREQYRILGAVEQVWVAPTMSSMMAALRIVAFTPALRGQPPKFVVKAGLRPVFPSFDFKWPAELQGRVRAYGRELSNKFYGTDDAFDTALEQLFTSYDTFRASQMEATRARTSLQVLANIHTLKRDLQVARLGYVLMVADRFVGSWLFMCALPPVDGSKSQTVASAEDNLRTLARSNVKGFARAGVAVATWETGLTTEYRAGMLYTYSSDPRYVTPFFKSFDLCTQLDEPGFPNFVPFQSDIHSNIKVLPFDDSGYVSLEAQAVRQNLPADAVWTRFMMKKKRVKSGWSTNENRIMSVSYGTSTADRAEKLAYITWADEYGRPQGFLKVTEADVRKVSDDQSSGSTTAKMTSSTSGKAWILSAHPTSEDRVVEKFIAAFNKAKSWVALSSATSM
mmetsp:Transcript_28002/g.65052  ORF Transcript_28002/g.65052 Transcript_28002/m.65052 type:complete len:495 (-) Transcript_28002:66-1550(-)